MYFRFFGIPVYVHPGFFIFLILFTSLYLNFSAESLIIAAILFFSLLIHEYGHASTAKNYGENPTIIFEPFGTRANYGFNVSAKERFFIILNGPLLQSLLIVIPYFLLKSHIFDNSPYLASITYMTMKLNFLWVAFNLIPVAPLDGFYLLSYFLEKRYSMKGHKAALVIGQIAAVTAAIYFYSVGYFFFGTLLMLFGMQNFQMLKNVKNPKQEESPFQNYLKGMEAMKTEDKEKGKEILKKLLKTKDAHIKSSAIEALAKALYDEGKTDESYDLLKKADIAELKQGKVLLCKLAAMRKNHTLITQHAYEIYEIDPSFEVAIMNARAFADREDAYAASGWLETASGFEGAQKKIEEELTSSIYNKLRDSQEFLSFAEKKNSAKAST